MVRAWKHRRVRGLVAVALLAVLAAAGWCLLLKRTQVFTLEPHDDTLYVPVTFGGSAHLCEIDSGCGELIFHTDLKRDLGERELLSPSAMRVIGGTAAVERFEPMDFQLGSDSFNSEYSVACSDLTHMREAAGVDIEGFIGLPFFHSHVVLIDFDNRRLEILPTSCSPRPEWGRPVRIFEENGRAWIDIDVGEGEKVRFSIDTGNSGTLSISKKMFSRLMKSNTIAHVKDAGGVSFAGFLADRCGLLERSELGILKSTVWRWTTVRINA